MKTNQHKCPCCGYYTLPAPQKDAVAFICPVCFWENDVCLQNMDEPSDENGGMTLREARKNYMRCGAYKQSARNFVRKPTAGEQGGDSLVDAPHVPDLAPVQLPHRLEELLACSMLMQASFCSPDEFISLVDALFLEDSENPFLQELEWSFHDIPRCIHLIDEYFKKTSVDDNVLSEILLSRLRAVYLSESLDMTEFTRRAYRLWSLLPEALANDDAFSALSCADEVLGGWYQKDPEKETRALLEKALGIRGDDIGEDASDQEQITPAKSGARKRGMKKQRTDSKPLTRMALYLLSVRELYTALAAIGGMAFVLMLIISFVKIAQGEMSPSGLGSVIMGALAITGILLLIGYFVVLGRTKPPYQYYKKRGIRFPACLTVMG